MLLRPAATCRGRLGAGGTVGETRELTARCTTVIGEGVCADETFGIWGRFYQRGELHGGRGGACGTVVGILQYSREHSGLVVITDGRLTVGHELVSEVSQARDCLGAVRRFELQRSARLSVGRRPDGAEYKYQ